MLKENLFHPFELGISGYSGSGKTTLLSKLIKSMANDFSIGYIKHDAHHFEMDHAGKDTAVAATSGALVVSINNSKKEALQSFRPQNKYLAKLQFIDCDFVFIEGYKNSNAPKLLVLDESDRIFREWINSKFENVIGLVGASMQNPIPGNPIPYFQRDNIDAIRSFVIKHFEKRVPPVYGLILGGGKSTRMGRDKSGLEYHGKPQAQVAFDLLAGHCQKVFISCRSDQTNSDAFKGLPVITDRLLDFGPVGGILSAMEAYPLAAWLVMACDLPVMNADTLIQLIEARNPYKIATAFNAHESGLPEPLCTIWEPKSRARLLEFMGLGFTCPRKTLMNSEIQKVDLKNVNAMANANTNEDFLRLKKLIQGEQT